MNMGEILKAAECGYENGKRLILKMILFKMHVCPFKGYTVCVLFVFTVVKTTVLLADMNDFTNVNDVYKQCKYYI